MENKKLKKPFGAELNSGDTETQTYGCRQNNPDICKYNGIPNVCAFNTEDAICRNPSKSWKKQYHKLLETK